MTPMEDPQCHPYIPPSAPDTDYSIPITDSDYSMPIADPDYGISAPQPSPFQVTGMESMSWTTWDNP